MIPRSSPSPVGKGLGRFHLPLGEGWGSLLPLLVGESWGVSGLSPPLERVGDLLLPLPLGEG